MAMTPETCSNVATFYFRARGAKQAVNPSRIRKYKYRPMTITGRPKASTLAALETEESGEYPCPYQNCGLMYARERSLRSHISRNHHENLKAACPECGKKVHNPSSTFDNVKNRQSQPVVRLLCFLVVDRSFH